MFIPLSFFSTPEGEYQAGRKGPSVKLLKPYNYIQLACKVESAV